MEEDYNPIRAIILIVFIILSIVIPVLLIKTNIRRVKQGKPETRFDNASIKSIFSIVGFIYPIFHFINWGFSQNQSSKCYRCGCATITYTNYCPNCRLDNSQPGSIYKYNYCLNTFTNNSKYCPKCGKDDNGKYKGGIS